MPYKIGITGHRHLADPDEIRQEITRLLIKEKKKHTEITCISAIASGADTIFAQEALKLGLPLQVILPFSRSDYEKDFNEADAIIFHQLLKSASGVKELNRLDNEDPDTRNTAYLNAGMAIADESDLLIAVWDGQKAEGKGGTADIVAHSINKKIHFIKAYRTELQKAYMRKDEEAEAVKIRHYRLWEITICLSFVTAVLFGIKVSFKLDDLQRVWISSIEFTILLMAVTCIQILGKGKLKKRRITCRREAERLRMMETLYNGKIQLLSMPNNSFISDDMKKLEEKYEQQKPHGNIDFKTGKTKLTELIDDQINYHKNTRTKKNEMPLSKLELAQKILFYVFIVLAFVHLAIAWFEWYIEKYLIIYPLPACLHEWSSFLSLLIPPAIASIEGYVYFREFKKNLMDSKIMLSLFTAWKERIDQVQEQDELTKLAHEIRLKMDEETSNWAIVVGMKDKPSIS